MRPLPSSVSRRGARGTRWLPVLLLILAALATPTAGTGLGVAGSAGPTVGAAALPGPHASVALAPSGAATSLASPDNQSSLGSAAWANITSSAGTAPPPRSYGRSFAYDPVDGYSVLFGGYGSGGGYLADTWTFAQGQWTQLHPKVSPSARDHGTLAWDPTDGYLVMFGGSGNSGSDSDTWTFLHGNWTQLSPTSHPSARWASSLTWDARDGYLLLFGGCDGAAVGDTWTFLGGQWTQLHPKPAPSARENVDLSFDPADNYTVLFGGDDYAAGTYADTWTYAGGNWTQLHPLVHPAARTEASMGWDSGLAKLVLFGGSVYAGAMFGDTWTFSSGFWSPAAEAASPPAREFGILSPWPPSNELVLFSGASISEDFDDTWVLYQLDLSASASATTGVAPLTVNFTSNVTGNEGNLSTTWNLGDGNSSFSANATETFAQPGQYFPSVQVTDGNGSQATVTFHVVVGPAMSATEFAAPTSGDAPLSVQCQGVAQGGVPPYVYQWTSGSGNQSTAPSPTFTYGAPGHYLLSVSIRDSAGSLLGREFNVTVNASPVQPLVVDLTDSLAGGPAPLTVFFASSISGGVSPYRIAWDFGDGGTSNAPSVAHTFASAGTFTVHLAVTDARGTVEGANASISAGSGLWLQASVAPLTIALHDPATFTASAGGGAAPRSFLWEFGDGLASASANTTHSYTAPGSYPVSVRVTDSLGSAQMENFTVTVTGSTGAPPPATTGASASPAGPSELEVLLIGLAVGVAATVGVVELLRRRGRP